MKNRFVIFFISLFLSGLILGGCGYRLVGTGGFKGANSIAIPVFKNNSSEPGIERNITTKVREAFIRDGRLDVISESDADLVFKGQINHYQLKAISFDDKGNATEYWVIMTIDVKVRDAAKDKYLVNQTFRTKWDYTVSSELVSSERARYEAIGEASKDFADKMVSIIIEGF